MDAAEPTPADVETALQAIAARPEPDIAQATGRAAYEAALAVQDAGGTDEDKVRTLRAFTRARARLEAESADLLLLP